MKAIVDYTDEEYKKQSEICNNILKLVKSIPYEERWKRNERKSGYAHYTFVTEPTEKMIEVIGRKPTTDEMIMIVDNGFSHFGASCSEHNGVYTGRVNTD